MNEILLPSDSPKFPDNIAGSIVRQKMLDGRLIGSSENNDTAACLEDPDCTPAGNTIKWQHIYPQGHLSVAQGFTGQRKGSFCGSQTQLYAELSNLYNSSWPGPYGWCKDCLPVDIQWGPTTEKTRMFGNIADNQISNKLESYDDYYISVVYQLLRINDPWPFNGKPSHPSGTILSLQVRGGGEILQIDPTAFTGGGKGQNISGCFMGVEYSAEQSINSRIRIPLTEYHITCDRITDDQICNMMAMPWKCREGTVNCSAFLQEGEGTLMFDTWTLDQTWAPDYYNPRRWRLSCVLKCRQVPQMYGPYPDDCNARCSDASEPGTPGCYPIGWNHDYKRSSNDGSFGWKFIMMNAYDNWTSAAASTPHTSCPSPYVPRYPYMIFDDMFCVGSMSCISAQSPSSITCANKCPDTILNNWNACTGLGNTPKGMMESSEDGYEDLEEAIDKIVQDSRKAQSRATWRKNAMEQAGFTEDWSHGDPDPRLLSQRSIQ